MLEGEEGDLAGIAVAYELREAYPMQIFMEASSRFTLRREMVRFARSHVRGLAPDAEAGLRDTTMSAFLRSYELFCLSEAPGLDGTPPTWTWGPTHVGMGPHPMGAR